MRATNKEHRAPLIVGDEQDALTGWRKWFHWKPGQLRRIKNQYRRRIRRKAKQDDQQL